MIKLGTLKDMDKVKHLDSKMQTRIKECLQVLDDNYGVNRDVDHSLGGFVLVLENKKDKELLKAYNLDVSNDIAEYKDEYDTFIEQLHLLGNDFSIVIFVKK